jgi:hypothetical protein
LEIGRIFVACQKGHGCHAQKCGDDYEIRKIVTTGFFVPANYVAQGRTYDGPKNQKRQAGMSG